MPFIQLGWCSLARLFAKERRTGFKNLTQLAACSWKRNGGKARAAVFHFLVRKTITIPNGLSLFPVKTIPALVGKNL